MQLSFPEKLQVNISCQNPIILSEISVQSNDDVILESRKRFEDDVE